MEEDTLNKTAWIIIGRYENWIKALNQPLPLWGLKPSYRAEFASLSPGSLAWVYVNKPIAGVVGLAMIRDKYIDEHTPLWPEELEENKVIWPLRFRLEIIRIFPERRWADRAIPVSHFRLYMQRGFQRLSSQQHLWLREEFNGAFGLPPEASLDGGPTVWTPKVADRNDEAMVSLHRSLQELVAEMGRLQHYHSQIEFPLDDDSEKLDVVWKRELGGVPTIAFEVEVSGVTTNALDRLRIAHERWAARPCIVVGGEDVTFVERNLTQSDDQFVRSIRVCPERQIRDVHRLKRRLRSLEETLGIY
ncbi:MAG: hypothetical protein N3C12_06770 [Candidatus Binatia bacterium]|nr:hypothetical protein [Candidatus Binatia bacterium]